MVQCNSDLIIQICAILDMMGLVDDLRDQCCYCIFEALKKIWYRPKTNIKGT